MIPELFPPHLIRWRAVTPSPASPYRSSLMSRNGMRSPLLTDSSSANSRSPLTVTRSGRFSNAHLKTGLENGRTPKLGKALEYLATLNTTATAKPDKWVVNASILASLTGCYRPAINTFIEARKQRIDELNAAHGLGPGHNRATARTHPNAIPELVQRFKEEVLGQPF